MRINHEVVIPVPVDEVFAWHERPGAMQRLLPPWQPVRAVSQAESLRDGVSVIGLPAGLAWRARHSAERYRAQRLFVDELASGGLLGRALKSVSWTHEHHFDPLENGHTLVRDVVETNIPALQVNRMLAYRHRELEQDLAAHRTAAAQGLGSLRIAVSGAHGLVGTALCAFLESGGHTVIRLVRRDPQRPNERTWDPADPSPQAVEGCDAVIHLAGASIAGRFTDKHRQNIAQSRIDPTRKLAAAAEQAGVKVFVSASAIGIYGAQAGEGLLDEQAPAGTDFLAQVVRDWEQAAAESAGRMRCVQVRTGLVQSPRGGTLKLLKPLYAAGLGGRLGDGLQWQSWIGLDDLVDVYHRALWDDKLNGPVNAVAPHPVRNSEYSATLASVLGRPEIIPVPSFGPELLLGKQGSELLAMASQRVEPAKLKQLGHRFRAENLEAALRHCLGR
ncbi:nucleoside-diphosphate sugar epimerase [Glutamicibacter uratoxydans]|uniref:Nucleoside-diphosphate sugar epimerase n=1 Tax=Glutamicibacter uratoxydans TaxID=43667 RepID=A0A4Y4DV09_GLUUR|nr:TIGR01777 family oxidoreductase [Glutamicibacter uratoxydans]GED07280.1 nucleoside-diphosphate sugar epimerase [Glutamicibacter uratoxydans]